MVALKVATMLGGATTQAFSPPSQDAVISLYTGAQPPGYYPYLVKITDRTGDVITFNGLHLTDLTPTAAAYSVDLGRVDYIWARSPGSFLDNWDKTTNCCAIVFLSPAYVTSSSVTSVDPNQELVNQCASPDGGPKWPIVAGDGPTIKMIHQYHRTLSGERKALFEADFEEYLSLGPVRGERHHAQAAAQQGIQLVRISSVLTPPAVPWFYPAGAFPMSALNAATGTTIGYYFGQDFPLYRPYLVQASMSGNTVTFSGINLTNVTALTAAFTVSVSDVHYIWPLPPALLLSTLSPPNNCTILFLSQDYLNDWDQKGTLNPSTDPNFPQWWQWWLPSSPNDARTSLRRRLREFGGTLEGAERARFMAQFAQYLEAKQR